VEEVRRSRLRTRAAWSAGAVLLAAVTGVLAAVQPAAASGSVSLFDDDGGSALFTGTLLAPGRTQTGCVSVDASGADPADDVVLSADTLVGAVIPYLTVTVDVGTGGHMGDCTGFAVDPLIPQWSGRLSALATGVSTGWHPAQAGTRTFRFTVAVDDNQAAAGISGSGRFVWQLTTTPPPPPPPPPPSPSPSASPSPSPSPSPSRSPSPTVRPTPDPTPTTDPTQQPVPPSTQPTGDPEPVPTSSDAGPTTPPSPAAPQASPTPPSSPAGTPTSTPSGSPTLHLGAGGTGGGDTGGGGNTRTQGGGRRADVVLGVPLPALKETARRLGDAALHIAQEPQYPLGVGALVFVFLLIQDLIDRRDPKLAAARVTSRDGSLLFPDLFPPGGAP
jgi:hypothetical protein